MELGFSLKIWMPYLRLWFPNNLPLSSTKSPPSPANRALLGCSNVGATSPPPIVAIACRKSPTCLKTFVATQSGESLVGRVLHQVQGVQIPASRTHQDALQALRETALGEIAKSVETGNGFYTDGYESVFVLGPCEGDLGSGNYVKITVEKSKSTCSSAISAQMYLQQCYITLQKQWQLSWEDWPVWPGVGSCLSAIHKISFQEKDPFQVQHGG
ncbi:uncharacterized protein LOC116028099 [Ipomoea triloba]|uniref:uncharacterized protein LOC116028099 n=1 Tax=Ipomoea triloba TaxID=35885 RepID=UPI00125E295F|nr:uncharacterized protein LOC116028099 [Ipomoea triloba]